MVDVVHKCMQLTQLETLGYISRLLKALNGLVYFLIIGDPRRDNLNGVKHIPKIVNRTRNTNRRCQM